MLMIVLILHFVSNKLDTSFLVWRCSSVYYTQINFSTIVFLLNFNWSDSECCSRITLTEQLHFEAFTNGIRHMAVLCSTETSHSHIFLTDSLSYKSLFHTESIQIEIILWWIQNLKVESQKGIEDVNNEFDFMDHLRKYENELEAPIATGNLKLLLRWKKIRNMIYQWPYDQFSRNLLLRRKSFCLTIRL